MNKIDLQKLYDGIQAAFHFALSTENNDEYTKTIINEIVKPITIAPQLESFRAFYKQQGLSKIAAFKEHQIKMLEQIKLHLQPLLLKESEVLALKKINEQYTAIIDSVESQDWKIFALAELLQVYIDNLLKDIRFTIDSTLMQIMSNSNTNFFIILS